MRTEKKSSIKNSATRLILIGLLVLIQTGWMIFLMMKLNTYSTDVCRCGYEQLRYYD